MKKIECLDAKKVITPEKKRRQKNILAYLVKEPKIAGIDCAKSNGTNEIIRRKRKVTEDLDASIIQYKAAKTNDADNIGIVDCIQKHGNILQSKATSISVILINDDNDTTSSNYANMSTASVKKSTIAECGDSKENIHISRPQAILNNVSELETKVQSSKSIKNNIILHEKSSIEKCTASLKEATKDLNSKTIERTKESDIKLLEHDVNNVSGILDEDWFIEDDANFDSLQRCRLIDFKYEQDALLLTVKTSEFHTPAVIKCSEFWKHLKVEKNSVIAVEARKDKDRWVVDNETGFVIIYPDILISGTTIVGGIFCKRRSILNEKFKKMGSFPSYRSDELLIVVGNFIHQLLQKALKADINKYDDIKRLLDHMFRSKEVANMLYAAGVTSESFRKEVQVFVPKIYKFIQHYIKNKHQEEIASIKNNFKGSIVDIIDIEETIWLPKLGIKGKVDVTVEVNINSVRKRMPLEIKTGRPSFSLEHKGQIILYIMMMALTGKNTDTGLLLYLRENSMQEINSGHRERRDLILLRNALAYYLAPKSIKTSSKSPSEWKWTGFDLPEPINDLNTCSKCPYNAICCAYLSKDSNDQTSNGHPLNQLQETISEYLLPSHINYALHWIYLSEVEDQAGTDNPQSNLWTLSPDERELRRICISNLKVLGTVKECDGKYEHIFVRNNSEEQVEEKDTPYMEFSENEYVLLSTDNRVNISSGFITHLSTTSVTVLLDRDITKYTGNESVHLDKYSSSSLHYCNLANLGGLLGNSEVCAKLRSIVIDKKPATFEQGIPQSIVAKSSGILENLNKNQRRAVLKVLTANDYILIKGMPGTGKTQTLVSLIELLHATGYSVLITSHTNSAVDNILLKLFKKRVNFLRLGSSVHEPLKAYCEKRVTANCKTPEEIDAACLQNIVGVTCYGAFHPLLSKRTFDVCVIDESAQIYQPTVLRPLYNARKFVLVGDPDQLPPIIKSQQARQLGADESLFSRLDSENNTVTLTEQYRMNSRIMDLANKLTYKDKLTTGNGLVENATYNANCTEILLEEKAWIQKTLSQDISDSVILLNTGCTNTIKANFKFSDQYAVNDQVCSNILEGAVLLKLVQTLLKMRVNAENIGIIAPYRAHVDLLRKIIQNGIEVNTVDQYQGRDKEIILYSCVKSLISSNTGKQDSEVLGDHRRLTVAITRAKCKLIIVGDKCTLQRYFAFKKLFNLIEDKNIVDLNNCDDFSWKEIVSSL